MARGDLTPSTLIRLFGSALVTAGKGLRRILKSKVAGAMFPVSPVNAQRPYNLSGRRHVLVRIAAWSK